MLGRLRAKRARKSFSHAPKTLTTPPHLGVLEDKEGCFRPSVDEKTLVKERILEASKFIVGRSCQLSIIIDNICAEVATELAVVPELRGVLQHPELHARYATAK